MTQALPNIPTMKQRHLKAINIIRTLADGNCWGVVKFDISRFLAYFYIQKCFNFGSIKKIARKSLDICYLFAFYASVSNSWHRYYYHSVVYVNYCIHCRFCQLFTSIIFKISLVKSCSSITHIISSSRHYTSSQTPLWTIRTNWKRMVYTLENQTCCKNTHFCPLYQHANRVQHGFSVL